jgi:hypothetical protein
MCRKPDTNCNALPCPTLGQSDERFYWTDDGVITFCGINSVRNDVIASQRTWFDHNFSDRTCLKGFGLQVPAVLGYPVPRDAGPRSPERPRSRPPRTLIRPPRPAPRPALLSDARSRGRAAARVRAGLVLRLHVLGWETGLSGRERLSQKTGCYAGADHAKHVCTA